MIERLVYFICLAVYLTGIILASFILKEKIKEKNSSEIIYWLALLFILIFFVVNCPLFSWSICNFIGG